jgi:tetratricopeptide (TPR) repeat protein
VAFLQQPSAEIQWAFAAFRGVAACQHARLGRTEGALRWVDTLIASLEQAPGWVGNYTMVACDAAEALWLVGRTDQIGITERNIRQKIVKPDFRYPMCDGRLAMARLCALQGRYDEAMDWFAKARAVLDERGARPLRAIADFDEALMYVRRGKPGDNELAAPLLNVALTQFRELGMTGWIRRAESLQSRVRDG